MDALTQLVATLDLRGRMDLRCLFGPGFSVPHAATGPWRAPFHVVLAGECEVWLPAQRRAIALRQGSLLVLPHGDAHVVRGVSARRGPAIRTDDGPVLPLKTNLASPEAAALDLLCGEFEFAGRRRSSVLDALPAHIVVPFEATPGAAWLRGLVGMMAHEIEQQQPGAAAIVAGLCGALFTLALRAHLAQQPQQRGVLGLMVRERLAPALQAMLSEPQRPWTVDEMARRCHLSRATFARQFLQAAGCGPIELLTTLRMELASRLLAQGGHDSASVGEAVGYRSEAAFNRAFARHAGVTPGRFRRAAGGRIATG
ncbi:AraC family transcriptional regulator [Rhizobacter sp. SG703]|uniref:AraC family transcriptional regulator n=1 Tax=Rhizobacter sp. SG703 TaxID=2587140 RepID=UPI001446F90B|nr:AraC family transcriptional regulator [Rhizobacter sp. SG703]NKI92378.1 AraC family transcriptional activator of mtrCDE [Rhizobacter sp. SG703]